MIMLTHSKMSAATGNMKSASVIAVNYPKEHAPSKQNGELNTAGMNSDIFV